MFVKSQIENYAVIRLHENDVDINAKCWQGHLKKIFYWLLLMNARHIKTSRGPHAARGPQVPHPCPRE